MLVLVQLPTVSSRIKIFPQIWTVYFRYGSNNSLQFIIFPQDAPATVSTVEAASVDGSNECAAGVFSIQNTPLKVRKSLWNPFQTRAAFAFDANVLCPSLKTASTSTSVKRRTFWRLRGEEENPWVVTWASRRKTELCATSSTKW